MEFGAVVFVEHPELTPAQDVSVCVCLFEKPLMA